MSLTVVPATDGPARSDVVGATDSPGAQAYGVLGEKVLLAARAFGGIVAITSAVEDEGKSSVAANLAIALALGGKRVMLVRADTHPPRTGAFEVDDWPGLLDVRSGRVPLSTALRPTHVPTLKLLGVGQASPGVPPRVAASDGLVGAEELLLQPLPDASAARPATSRFSSTASLGT